MKLPLSRINKKTRTRHIFYCLCLFSPLSFAQYGPYSPLSYPVQTALNNNPEIKQAWHAYQAAMHGVDQASSGYLPKVDISANIGYETRNYGIHDDYPRNTAELTISQMIYDGFKTSSEVDRFERIQQVRYYELRAKAEQVSLDAVKSYLDVAKYESLLTLAKQNLDAHQVVYEQIKQSVDAGVSRAADLEQIRGRLSLAESNVMTEMANLHDVNARYLRIVGELPPQPVQSVEMDKNYVPASINQALTMAYSSSPRFNASLHGIEAQNALADSRRSGYHPKVDLSARYGTQDRDQLGFEQTLTEARVGINVSYNLFNGGYDKASVAQAYDEVNIAKQQRDQACLEIRQNLQIAFNNVRVLDAKLPALEQHRSASEKVKVAYKDQFDIGQRTLLDVLDAENESFQSNRAYTSARYDRLSNVLTLEAEMGTLLKRFAVESKNLPTKDELESLPLADDTTEVCPKVDVAASLGHQAFLQQRKKQQEAYNNVTALPTYMALPKLTVDTREPEVDTMTPPADNDGDGVEDMRDKCPATPFGQAVDAEGCTLYHEKMDSVEIGIPFSADSSVVQPQYYREIERLADFMKKHPAQKVEIQGHASLDGVPVYNKKLSERRAFAVAKILIDDYDIAPERVTALGYGIDQPIINEISVRANAINRRIEAKLSVKGVAGSQSKQETKTLTNNGWY